MNNKKFPIGKFEFPLIIDNETLVTWIEDISSLPELLRIELENLKEIDLNKTYRKDGWTIRQIVHHLADSHMNSFIRLKLSLTEYNPTIKPYFEEKWAGLIDSKVFSVDSSLKIIEGVHARWVYLLKSLTKDELDRTFFHPEHQKSTTIKENIGMYAWHGLHHLAHIKLAKKSF